MNKLLKLLILLPVMALAVSCSNDDEPTAPNQKGEIENGFFTNLSTSTEYRVFRSKQLGKYRKYNSEKEWKLETEIVDGDCYADRSFTFRGGKLYFAVDWHVLLEGYFALGDLYFLQWALYDAGHPCPLCFVASKLDYNTDKRQLSYNFYTYDETDDILSAGGDRFKLASYSHFTSSTGEGTFMYIYEYVQDDSYYLTTSMAKAKYFNSWKELAYYLIDEVEEVLGADYKAYEYGPTHDELRKIYSAEQYEQK